MDDAFKRADAARRESERRYSLLFDHSPVGVALTRMHDGVLVDANQAFLDLFQATRGAVIGRTSVDAGLSTAEDRAQVAAELDAKGAVRDFECRRRTLRGEERIVSLSLTTLTIGDELHVLTTVQDVTARRRAEEMLREAREVERQRLLSLLAQIPAVVNFLRGPDMVIEFAHPKSIAALAGRDIVGKPLLEAIPEHREQPHYERLRRVYETGEPDFQREVHTWAQIDGRRVDMYWDSAKLPVRDASGKIEGVMTFEVEVTKNVLAKRELESANRAKDEFLATMSHELRTPLTAILGWATILQSKPRDEGKLERGLEVIGRNARALERIVGDLLDVSRIISGKLQLTLRRADISAVVFAAVDVVRPAAEAKGVRLVVELDPDLGVTVADTDRLQQVVWNLLSNAVRFTPRGGRVTVMADRKDDAIQIRVADTGAGIPGEHLPHVFERFRQVDSSMTRAHGGLGLGLAIVRHIAEAHGGHVGARSEGPDRGATFTVVLPARGVDVAPTTAKVSGELEFDAIERAPGVAANLRGVRLLIVDDDPDSLELVGTVLRGAGASVTTAASAREALDAQGTFDLILTDIAMPEMDGYAFLRRLRSRATAADIPAIALTAYARSEDVERAIGSGFQEHLKKPIEPAKLLEAVKTWANTAPGKEKAR
jgi:PAS domain S-box-containing protein